MPRAQSQVSALLDHIRSIRSNMSALNDALIQVSLPLPPPPPLIPCKPRIEFQRLS